MPDTPFNPGLLYDPENYLKAQRAQMVADALTRFSFTPDEPTNQGRQTSRVSPLSVIAKVLGGKMAGNALDRSIGYNTQVYQNMIKAQQDALSSPARTGGSPGFFASPEYGGGQAPTPGVADQGDVYRRAIRARYAGAPDDVVKAYLANNAPTETVKTGEQLGVSPEAIADKTYGIGMRSGEALRLPNGNVIRNPNLSPNLEPVYQGDQLQGARAIPGSAEGLGQIEQAQTRGKLMGGMVDVPQAGGGPALPMLATDYFGLNKQQHQIAQEGPGSAPAPASSQGAAGSQPPGQDKYWEGMPLYREPTGIGSQGTRAKATSQAVVDEENKRRDAYGQLAKSAMIMSQNTEYMLPHLKNSTVGAGSDVVNHMRSLFAHTGWVSPETLDKLSDTEIVNKYLTRNGTEGLMARFGSRLAQAEVSLAVNKQSPNLTQQQKSILTLTVADQVKNAYDRQMAQDFKSYIAKGGDPREYETWYQEHHSLEDFSKHNAGNITKRVMSLYNGGTGAIRKQMGGKWYTNPTGKPGDWELEGG